MPLSEQLNKRKENDNRAMNDAFSDLASVLGDHQPPLSGGREEAETDAIGRILSHLGVKGKPHTQRNRLYKRTP